jgi:SAM-dependent methyltransferase
MIRNIWVLKALIQKTISFLPYHHSVNFLFQKYVTKGVRLTDALFEDKLIHCRNHLHYFSTYATSAPSSSLEIGTGWYPIVPIGLYLFGFEEIVSVDISDLLTTQAVHDTIERYDAYLTSGRLSSYLTKIDMARFARLKELLTSTEPAHALLQKINIKVLIGDARQIDRPDDSFDLVNSNNTFEHIYPEILIDIVKEFKRLLKPTGIMSHQIDMSDHFAHLDKSITIYNFLRYSDKEWSLIDNTIQPQNRLRVADFRKIFHDLGLKIIQEQNRDGDIHQLKSLRPQLDTKYKSYSDADLAVSHSLFILKK